MNQNGDTSVNQGQLTHFDEHGRATMVDISNKEVTYRVATARVLIDMLQSTRERVEQRLLKKGDVLLVAELAASMGAKKTPDLIPLCHPIPLTSVQVAHHFLDRQGERATLEFQVTVSAHYRTGIEMEALTACSVAALTVYDMCKAIDRGMVIRDLQVVHKSGGKSGTFNVPMASTD